MALGRRNALVRVNIGDLAAADGAGLDMVFSVTESERAAGLGTRAVTDRLRVAFAAGSSGDRASGDVYHAACARVAAADSRAAAAVEGAACGCNAATADVDGSARAGASAADSCALYSARCINSAAADIYRYLAAAIASAADARGEVAAPRVDLAAVDINSKGAAGNKFSASVRCTG